MFYIVSLLLSSTQLSAQEDTSQISAAVRLSDDSVRIISVDSAVVDSAVVLADTTIGQQNRVAPRQVRVSVDIFKPISAALLQDRMGLELMADYYWKKELYWVAEGGGGSVRYEYADLNYTASNAFFRLGIDKSMLARITPNDWDMVFLGARYGMALVQLSEASYTMSDPFWGSTSGRLPARNFTGHWLEVTGGMRVELVKCLFVGWNVRGRFLLNRSAFDQLAPYYIAGYGRGDKNGVFDFNFYFGYAFRRGS